MPSCILRGLVKRGSLRRLALLNLPTYSPWLNSIEMPWRNFKREVAHCELFNTIDTLLDATREFFDRYKQRPEGVLSVPHGQQAACCPAAVGLGRLGAAVAARKQHLVQAGGQTFITVTARVFR